MFYQYVRTAALNQQQQTQHVSVFKTELFAHYLHIRCLSVKLVKNCRQLAQKSLTDEVQRYQKRFFKLQNLFTTDVLLLNFVNFIKHITNSRIQMAISGETMPGISYPLGTSELVELLQQAAVERLTTFRQLEAQGFSSVGGIVTTDFEALYAYKCGEYQRCLQLSTHNVHTLIGAEKVSWVFVCPEFIQLMDDDIVSLNALTLIVNQSLRELRYDGSIFTVLLTQLSLSLYLMTQCQMKLHHSVSSLDESLRYIEVARRHMSLNIFPLDQLLLKLIERKILLYR